MGSHLYYFVSVVLLDYHVLQIYKYRKVSSVRDEAKHEGLNLRKPEELTLESQYEKLKNQLDIDHWENKRIERPWEEGVEKNAEKS
ncbi:Protein of unknown function [Cotesia congregata]|uniref:Cytochrome c oxidase assembly protein COX16 homolog, mitochondrial n=1 Tax=Cotesia congregata TaxID=51543 RepID=A0A8J2HRM6_COTCN|nr:Protein of unknown function [Cotesia congregata]